MSCHHHSRKTDFQSVREFNETFGVPVFDEPQLDIFDREPALIRYRMSLIEEEFNELVQAVAEKNFTETVDALADLVYVIQGMGVSLGIDLDKAFDIVHRSNMSKVCSTEEEAKATVQYYRERKDALGYDSPAYRMTPNRKRWVVYNKSTMKVLKNINYVPANFESMLSPTASVEHDVQQEQQQRQD